MGKWISTLTVFAVVLAIVFASLLLGGIPELAPKWGTIASEVLRLLATAGVAFGVGFIAWKRGWLGRKQWDQEKLRYELFRDEQRRRLDLLADMREAAEQVDNAVLVVHMERLAAFQLSNKGNDYMGDAVKAQRRAGKHDAIKAEQIVILEKLAARYGMSPDTDEYQADRISHVIRAWKQNLDAAMENAPHDWSKGRQEIHKLTGQMQMMINDLINMEQNLLVTTEPSPALDPTRPVPTTRYSDSLLKRRNRK